MRTISESAREELTKCVLEMLLARLDAPVSLPMPKVALEPMGIDDDWSLFEGLIPEEVDKATSPADVGGSKTPVSGTKPITIRVHNRVLRAFRDQAEKTGTAYQTLMNRALANAADAMK